MHYSKCCLSDLFLWIIQAISEFLSLEKKNKPVTWTCKYNKTDIAVCLGVWGGNILIFWFTGTVQVLKVEFPAWSREIISILLLVILERWQNKFKSWIYT